MQEKIIQPQNYTVIIIIYQQKSTVSKRNTMSH